GRTGMAGLVIPGARADRVSEPDHRHTRSFRDSAFARAGLMLDAFDEIVLVDFEFTSTPGNRPQPVCLVARELRSGRTIRLWHDQFGFIPPYATDKRTLFVAYYASAELGCHRARGWPMPERILDLFTEFRDRTNGLETIAGSSLLGALAHFGIDHIDAN